MITHINKNYGGDINRLDIIAAIRSNDVQKVTGILEESPSAINAIDSYTGKNSAMLAAAGILPTMLRQILKYANHLDFEHEDNFGNNLFTNAVMSEQEEIMMLVKEAYSENAAHILNNWPSPNIL